MNYTKVNKDLHWCGEKKHCNQLIGIRKHPHKCQGEHLIDYKGTCNYGLFLDFDSEKTYKKVPLFSCAATALPDTRQDVCRRARRTC